MSVSSADPELLRSFVENTAPAVAGAEAARREVSHLQSDVCAASPDYNVDTPIVEALFTTLTAMGDNQRFVSTICAELLAADTGAPGVGRSVSDVRLELVLAGAGLGSPPPVLEFEPTQLHGLPPTSGFVDDPICAANGNMVHQEVDLVFPGVAATLDLVRTYNSLPTSLLGAFGPGWSSMLDVRLLARDSRVEVVLPDGATAVFTWADASWAAHGRRVRRLEQDAAGWLLIVDDLRTFRFDRRGALTGWTVGPSAVVVRRELGRVVAAHEQRSGRSWSVEWDDGSDCVRCVVSSDGRSVQYERDDARRLTRASSASGHVTYEWHDRFLTGVVDADGVRLFRNEYDATGRVIEQTSPFGRTTNYRYADGLTVIGDEHDDARQAMAHDLRGNLLEVIDTDGSAMRLRYDESDRVVEVVGRGGATWRHEFDAEGRLTARIDPDGLSESWAWDAAGRMASRTDRTGATTAFVYAGGLRTPERIGHPDGTVTTVTVDTGLDRPLTVTDDDGRVIRLEYDTDGQPVVALDAEGARVELRYDPAGRLTECRTPSGATALGYDEAGRLVRCERDGAITTYLRTPAGRVCGGTEPGGGSWTTLFGEHGAPGEVVDENGATLRFEYDAIGNVVAVGGPDGAVYRQEYDTTGVLTAIVDPAGARTRVSRDACGHVVGFTDAAGRELRREADVLGRTVDGPAPALVHRAPSGQGRGPEFRVECDAAGRVVAFTDATGVRAGYEWDTRGLLTAAVDPAGLRTEYRYDRCGRLIAQTVPGGRVTTWEYDFAGRIKVHRDPAGVETRFVRDAAGIVVEMQRGDALGAARPPTRCDVSYAALIPVVGTAFDTAGRIVLDADGAAYRYDAAGRLTQIDSPGGGRTRFEYGDDGLIALEQVDRRLRRFGYDIAGRVTSVVVEGGSATTIEYDAAGRRWRETCSDGTAVEYRWADLHTLAAVIEIAAGGERTVTELTGPDHTFGSLVVLGARVLDRRTHQFLTPDPLPTVPASHGSASAYTYAWHDPVNFVDPSGLRPISQRDWNAIRQREERGRLGEAWDAVADDPWGALALGVVITGGAVLCVTPLAPVGAGILIGTGASMGAGIATGTLDPRQVALAGLVGGAAGGAGAAGLSAGWSVVTGGAVGAGGDLAAQVLAGSPVDWRSVAVTGGVTSLTGGIANRLGGKLAVSPWRSAFVGAGTDAGGSVATQGLTGDHPVDLTLVVIDSVAGGATGAANDVFQGARLPAPAMNLEPGAPWWPAPDPRSIVLDVNGVAVRHVDAEQRPAETSWN